MNPLDVHLRLLSILPVRTVRSKRECDLELPYAGKPRGGTHTPADTLALHERIVALHAEGKTRFEISEELDVSLMTLSRHLTGKVKTVNRAKGAKE